MADNNGLLGKLDADVVNRARSLAYVDFLWRIKSGGVNYYTAYVQPGHKDAADKELGSIDEQFRREHPEMPIAWHQYPAASHPIVEKDLYAKQERGLAVLLYTRQTIAMKTVTPDSPARTSRDTA